MNNTWDNEYTRKQLYNALGKPKGFSYEEYGERLDKMVKELHQQDVEAKNFRKEYDEKHKFCPNCGSENYITTFMAFPLKEDYKDLNDCTCNDCGNKHTRHERAAKG